MKRRTVLAGFAALALVPRVRAAERPRLAILHSGFPRRTPIDRLFEALRVLGYEDGRTASIALHGAEGDSGRLTALVAQIAAENPDVVIGLTTPAARALKQGGVTAPVVFAFVSDPVALGIVDSLARPGANFTGVSYSDAVLGSKRLELLADALPGMRRVAVVWGRQFPDNQAIVANIAGAAATRGIAMISRPIGGPEDLAVGFAAAAQAGAQGMIFLSDNTLVGHRKEIAALALRHRLPSMHSYLFEVEDGGLMYYGPDIDESYRRAAALADRILKGAKPGSLPVEEPTVFIFAINLKTAQALGITIPPSLLARADTVIE